MYWSSGGPGAYYYITEINDQTGAFTRKKHTSTSKLFKKTSEGSWRYKVEWCLQPDGYSETCSGLSNTKTVDVQEPVGTAQLIPFEGENLTGNIEVKWNRPTGTVKRYKLKKRKQIGKGLSEEQTYTISGSALSYRVGPFDTGRYRFDLEACNDFDCRAGTDRSVSVMLRPQHVNDFNAVLTGGNDREVLLSWTKPQGKERIDTYRIRVKKPGESAYTVFDSVSSDKLTYTVSGLGGGLHFFRVQACNKQCSEFDPDGWKAYELNKPTTAVVLGDSFSSGEAGRWKGNSDTGSGDYGGTNISFDGVAYESESYDTNACHRALGAPIHSLADEFEFTKNLACSGAKNNAVWPESEGGLRYRGESPQIDKLEDLLETHDVKLVVVGVGGSDMGFISLIQDCAQELIEDLTTRLSEGCGHSVTGKIKGLNQVRAKVKLTVSHIKNMMERHGKVNNVDYEIVLMGYPSIVEDDPGPGLADRLEMRCPFRAEDVVKIESRLMPALNGLYASAAVEEDVNFINIKNVFEGHKLCNGSAYRAGEVYQLTASNTEWVRFLDTSVASAFEVSTALVLLRLAYDALGSLTNGEWNSPDFMGHQGRIQESMHPNFYGQKAVGQCLQQFWQLRQSSATPQSYNCYSPLGVVHSSPEDVILEQRPERVYTQSVSQDIFLQPGEQIVVPVNMNFNIDGGWNSLNTGSFYISGEGQDAHAPLIKLVNNETGEEIVLKATMAPGEGGDQPIDDEPFEEEPLLPFGAAHGSFYSLQGLPFTGGIYDVVIRNSSDLYPLLINDIRLSLY
ncbi:hypothetical protein AT746_03410 [Lacimicrobium alkaliphilum]|uniref:Fibronectin type-III domain-containing protein n=1 Tax=Lacimicrobium alkaliphilum TaxID=1526571 RepID=A0A0U3B701_9ALTE|nr:hypothetical protein AT746_03410 [Lacimicrobium alkaliphilum]